jgi:hypothetical protein
MLGITEVLCHSRSLSGNNTERDRQICSSGLLYRLRHDVILHTLGRPGLNPAEESRPRNTMKSDLLAEFILSFTEGPASHPRAFRDREARLMAENSVVYGRVGELDPIGNP